ncbi:MAG: 23S rRNA (pseudouridine(1915)-N(3))-methyltransferase RlmH [Clostridiales bacterium]|nr:23S rRNA (pseudouridine(1915)-N(3))-methyltransferase RlmH [Clostridiales bacterium]
MKKITVLCVGKASKSFCRDGCDEYLKRLRSFFDVNVIEIPEQPTVRREGDELLKRMSGECALLDIGGEQLSSEQFAELVRSSHERADRLTFIIGGASGVDGAVRERCNRRVSFGRVTYPHQIARLLLFEQIYRAATIINGLPYHK